MLPLPEVLTRTFHFLGSRFAVDELVLSLLDREQHVLRTVAVVNARGVILLIDEPDVMHLSEPAEDHLVDPSLPAVRRVTQRARGPTNSSQPKDPERPEFSLMVLRLPFGDQEVGSLVLGASGEARHSAEDQERLGQLEQALAAAIRNGLHHQAVLDEHERLQGEHRELSARLARPTPFTALVGADGGLAPVMAKLRSVAGSSRPVLLLGEPGVGKGTLARTVHALSPRRDAPFIEVACGCLAPELADSDLFGHEKGAFLGAIAPRVGSLELANKGTLFLRDIGELPTKLHARLLAALLDGEFTRVGGAQRVRSRPRLVAASQLTLEELFETEAFGPKSWARLDVLPIRVPPLRERTGDVHELARQLVAGEARWLGRAAPELGEQALGALKRYSWPGNVSELRAVIQQALLTTRSAELAPEDLRGIGPGSTSLTTVTAPTPPAPPMPTPLSSPAGESDDPIETLDTVISSHLKRALAATGGRIEGPGGAAALLGLNASTLRHRLRRLRIPFGRAGSPGATE